MLYGDKSRTQLNEYLEKTIAQSERIKSRAQRKELYNNLIDKFNLDTNVSEEIITFKKDLSEFTTFELFCVLWFLDRDSLPKFFTQTEIETLSNEKYSHEELHFPIVFNNMVQVTDDQWIGRIDVEKIMALKNGRFINYDENEQRALRRVKYGDVEIFKPFVSEKNVEEIRQAMENGTYIPDPITLNMPEGSQFTYDNYTLTVESLPRGMFNLDDGYHRYLAMSRIYDFDKSFNYPMELRVVNFSNGKANDFIFQQDQKTLMKRIVSDTYNTNSIPNKVIASLNADPSFLLKGLIGRNNANIDSAVLAKLIRHFYIKKQLIKRGEDVAYVVNIKQELKSKFNALVEQDTKFAGKYTNPMLFTTMYVFAMLDNIDKYGEIITNVVDNLTDEEMKYFRITPNGMVRKVAIDVIRNKIGGMNNV